MLRSLYPHIDWPAVDTIGFDMDGTLYDEAEFISQVYQPISEHIARQCNVDARTIHRCLMRRWLQKGSSYSKLFSDVLSLNGIADSVAGQLVSECVQLFRAYKPTLRLPARSKAVLDYAHGRYALFLVTDGSSQLQRAKFDALGLEKWFSPENIGISGDYGPHYQKPSIQIVQKIDVLKTRAGTSGVAFFGDRTVDGLFAAAAGFTFIEVRSLYPTARQP